ncbi:MAG: hypothetical protein JO170_26035, partial [Verrucomicrobia bacterium]|nr:hypothetical protein [Verrucomicrobiota bacterium]
MKASLENVQISVEDRNGPAQDGTPASDLDQPLAIAADEESLEATEVNRERRIEAAMQGS